MDLQALTVGVAVVSMGAWLASARSALLQDANATLDASRKLAVVNGLGEHSRAQVRGRTPKRKDLKPVTSAITFQGVPCDRAAALDASPKLAVVDGLSEHSRAKVRSSAQRIAMSAIICQGVL